MRSCAVATGLSLGSPGTTLGNKGGVGISFDIGATSCVFVNSHLAAHQNNVRERNEHFFAISQGLVRELGGCVASSCGGKSTAVAPPDAVAGRERCEYGVRDDRMEQPPSSDAASRGEGGLDSNQDRPNPSSETLPPQVMSPSKAAATAESSAPSPSPKETKETQSEQSRADTGEAKPTTHLAGAGVAADACSTPPLTPDPQMAPFVPSDKNALPSPSRSRREENGHFKQSVQAGRGRAEARVEETAGGFFSKTLPQVFDRVVWAGDLNYRINAPRAVADLLLSKDMHGVLLNNEQLSLERGKDGNGDKGGLFSGYSEGPLNFRPTYKFDTGTDTYDTSSKQRVPAWTDRILYSGAGSPTTARTGGCKEEEEEEEEGKTRGEKESDAVGTSTSGIQLRAYRSVEELKTSDHRPVLASFVMEFDQREGGGDSGDTESEGVAVTNQTSSQVCSVM